MSVHNVNFVEYFSDQKGEKAKWPWSINKHPQKETLNLKNSMSDAEGRKLDIKFVLLLLSKVRQIWSVCCFNQYYGEKKLSTASLSLHCRFTPNSSQKFLCSTHQLHARGSLGCFAVLECWLEWKKYNV